MLRALSSCMVRAKPTVPSEWRRGLIVGHNHIGDVLYRTCSLPALAKYLPECRWDYLAGVTSAEVLAGNPAISEVFPDQIGDDSWTLRSGALKTLRARRYDVVLCTNILRYYPDLMLALAIGAPNRVGYTLKGFSGLVTRPVASGFPQPYPGYFRAMVSAVTQASPSWPLIPRVYPSRTDKEAALAALSTFQRPGTPLVACSLTTRQPSGWPREHFLRALEIVHRKTGAQIVLFGAPDELALLREAARECAAPCAVLEAGLNLRALSHFLSRCWAALTPDSGPRHLANAAGTPVVFARSLNVRRVETGAYCDNETDAGPPEELLTPEQIRAVVARHDPAHTAALVLRAMRAPAG
jgi:ADP-heptose:LPS heptosyltransferase